jgi:hypothetical protein
VAPEATPNRAERWLLAIAGIPLWVCVVLALASHFFLHALATRSHLILTDPEQVHSVLPCLVLQALFLNLHYLAPLVLVVGVPLLRCIAAARVPAAADAGNAMTACEFEALTAGGLRPRHGFAAST